MVPRFAGVDPAHELRTLGADARLQLWHMWQPMAMSAAVPMATASAPRAMAFTMSTLLRMVPLATRLTRLRRPSFRRRLSTAARASSVGMPTLSRVCVGAAPVPPRRPSMTMTSAPDRAMPLVMAAALCTAAIFTRMGFSYRVASFRAYTSCRRSSME